MPHRFAALAAAALLVPVLVASPAAADGPSSYCATWGCASWDVDVVAGGAQLQWSVDDTRGDGHCVYFYIRRVGGSWGRQASSCGPISIGSVRSSVSNWDGTAMVTRGPYPGVNYFTLFNSQV